jgi:hypothetical protein
MSQLAVGSILLLMALSMPDRIAFLLQKIKRRWIVGAYTFGSDPDRLSAVVLQ